MSVATLIILLILSKYIVPGVYVEGGALFIKSNFIILNLLYKIFISTKLMAIPSLDIAINHKYLIILN